MLQPSHPQHLTIAPSLARKNSTPMSSAAKSSPKARGRRAREQLDHHQHRRWPTDDKPAVTLTAPDPNTTSSFLNIRVANIKEIYDDWSAKGAQFLTPPVDHGVELRCYLHDPDGHLIEVGQANRGS